MQIQGVFIKDCDFLCQVQDSWSAQNYGDPCFHAHPGSAGRLGTVASQPSFRELALRFWAGHAWSPAPSASRLLGGLKSVMLLNRLNEHSLHSSVP